MNRPTYLTITNLTSNTSYQTSLYFLSTQSTYQILQTVSYNTLPFDPVVSVIFNFNSELDTIQKKYFLESLAYTLSIPLTQITSMDTANLTQINAIIGQVQNQEEAPKPSTLVKNLYVRPSRIKSRIKQLIL